MAVRFEVGTGQNICDRGRNQKERPNSVLKTVQKEFFCLLHTVPECKSAFFSLSLFPKGKVALTWDEVDPERENRMREAFYKIDGDDDMAQYKGLIASSSDDDDDVVVARLGVGGGGVSSRQSSIATYRALIADIQEAERKKAGGKLEVGSRHCCFWPRFVAPS